MPTAERLPELLIIGAMKSGTTTLYQGLVDRANVFLEEKKEPHCLAHDHVLTPEGRAEYAALYARAKPDQLLCDASTGYTKLPDVTGVVDRALAVLPEGFKAVYVVRHPVQRAISHFRHENVDGRMSNDIDAELRGDPSVLNYSRYAMQLRPWLDALGPDRVKVVVFEEMIADPDTAVADVAAFAGRAAESATDRPIKAYNQSTNKPYRTPVWDAVAGSIVYRKAIRPLIPLRLRLRLFELLLPKADPTKLVPSGETLQWLRDELAPDAAEMAGLLGREPLWPDLAPTATA